jgi:hypothetical protein
VCLWIIRIFQNVPSQRDFNGRTGKLVAHFKYFFDLNNLCALTFLCVGTVYISECRHFVSAKDSQVLLVVTMKVTPL